MENIWRAKIYQVGTQFAKVLKGIMINCEQWTTRKIFGGREFLSHMDFFLLHRAKEILSKKKGEKVRVGNILPIVVNHSWFASNVFPILLKGTKDLLFSTKKF